MLDYTKLTRALKRQLSRIPLPMARGRNSRHRPESQPRHQVGNNDDSDDDDGYLRIGGVRINVTPHGNVAGMSNRKPGQRQQRQNRRQQQTFFSNDDDDYEEFPLEPGEMDSEDMLDYLQNIGASATTAAAAGSDSDDDGNEGGPFPEDEAHILGTSTGRRRHFEMLRRFGGVEIGDEGAPEDIIGRFYDEDEESEESSEEEESGSSCLDRSSRSGGEDSKDDDAGSLSSFSGGDDEEEEEERGVGSEDDTIMGVENKGVLTLDELEQLPTAIRYPVAVRPTPVLISGEKQGYGPGGGGKKGKNGKKKGRNSGGKSPPGEKARLRREKIESKRAGRAVDRGFDLAGINKQLENFVQEQHDMHAFPPMPKHECRQVQKLAHLYGCKAGVQGSGKKRNVMVVMTARTALPEGDALLEIGRLLTTHTAIELARTGDGSRGKGRGTHAAAIPGLWVGGADSTGKGGGHDDGIKTGKGRWADFKKKGPRSSKSAAHKRQELGNNNASTSLKKKQLRPVAFVSRGTINPDDDTFEVYDPEKGATEEILEEEEGDVDIEGGAGPSLLLPVFEDRTGGSTTTLSESSSSGDGDEEDGGEAVDGDGVEGDLYFRPMLGASTIDDGTFTAEKAAAAAAKSKCRKETQKRKKQKDRLQAAGLLSYSSRGADAAEGITNSGRLLGLGMALGIGAQVFNTAGAVGNDNKSTKAAAATAAADLSPLEPMLSKTAQKELAKRKKRGSSTGGNSSHSFVAVASPVRTAARATPAGPGPGAPGVSGEYGDFEAHTTGIGSKLLAKWGFAGVGSGLGRGGTGISEPLQVKMRAKGLGLGAER